MRTTYPEAQFNFVDVTALRDSTAVSTAVKDFSIPALFREDARQVLYGTVELNQFVLDGSREIFPITPDDIPFWSDELSDSYGQYVKNPVLEVNFTGNHSSIGLNLYFAEDVPAEILITWYTLYGTRLISATFYPDSKEYFCRQNVKDYGKITIEVVASSWPYRYAKMNYVEYGQMWTLSRDKLKTASVYEEIDLTSATLSINTAQIEIIDTANEFALSNQNGLWKSLQKEQEIQIVEHINDRKVDCGTFFMDTWESSDNSIRFSLIDLIGIMDKTKFYGGTIYNGVKAGTIIDAVMTSCGVTKYTVDKDVYDTVLSGWVGIQSHRAALQQVVFACGAVADCSRSDRIKIYRPDRHVSYAIGLDRKFMGTKITPDDYISSVSVAYKQYSLSSEVKEISKSVRPAGDNRIEFTEPYLASSIVISAGVIKEARTNYVIVTMTAEAECIITGQKYEAVENACTASVPLLEAGETEKSKTYGACTLMDARRARKVAEYILDYYQLRQIVDLRYINDGEGVGNWCDIASRDGHSTTSITSQTLDLTGGNLATAKCRGYSRTVTSYYFAGNELYAGEEGVI